MSLKSLMDYTFVSKYARWIPEKKRRETWNEAVDRVKQMMLDKYVNNVVRLSDYSDQGRLDKITEEIEWAYGQVRKKRIMGSQRALQFGGNPIFKHNARIYNCAAAHVSYLEFFQQCMYLLLCGCGTGFSVQKHHISQLPNLLQKKEGNKKFIIPDSIEGWSDAVGVLVSSYFDQSDLFSEYNGVNVNFDYTNIRPAGSRLGSSGGKAPGPEPLKKALSNIRKVLDECLKNNQKNIRPIQVYDIIMHFADAVISGGIRRCISEGSQVLVRGKSYKDIKDVQIGDYVSTDEGWSKVTNTFNQGKQNTLKIKHGNGELICTPNHRLAVVQNISNEFIWKRADELRTGDCLLFVDNSEDDFGINKLPDFTYNKPLKSTTCKNIVIPNLDENIAWLLGIIQGDGYVRLTSNAGNISIAVHGEDIEQRDKIIKCLEKFGVNVSIVKPSNKDNSFKIRCKSKQLAAYFQQWLKKPNISMVVPNCIKLATKEIKAAYLQGIMDSDGCIKSRPKHLVTSIYPLWTKELQVLAHTIGIQLTFKKCSTSGLKKNWSPKYSLVFKGSLELNKLANMSKVGYKKEYEEYKFEKDYEHSYPISFFNNLSKKPKRWYKTVASNSKTLTLKNKNKLFGKTNKNPVRVLSIEEHVKTNTYDIEVENDHCFICNGVLVHNSATLCMFSPNDEDMAKAKTGNWFIDNPQRGRSNNSAALLRDSTTKEQFSELMNSVKEFGEPGFIWLDNEQMVTNPCCEVGMYPIDVTTGKSGFQMCNLSTINCAKIKTEQDFYNACRAASIIGTLQAGFTDFPYLGETSENIVRREALLGVSMTGIMEKHEICLDPSKQRRGADIVKKTNQRIAELIDINQSARTTCVKPEGTVSCILGTSSGIHPHHAKRYIRRVQANKMEPIYNYFKEINPLACEESVWSQNDSDDVISFCVEVPDGSKTKNKMGAVELLEIVKSTQKNWTNNGKNEELCTQPWLEHNVSNTINVKPEEWKDVESFIYKNRRYFCGVSLLPISGDKDFAQAPFTTVYLPSEQVAYYGDASIFVSGLIEVALNLWEDDLWAACDSLLGIGKPIKGNGKKKFKERCERFADKYYDGDLRKLTYNMKDTFNWKLWTDLNREYLDIDYTQIIEHENNVVPEQEIACAGGVCELV